MISGLPESTLRYYEQIGIIDPIARDPSSGHRVYSDKDIESLTTIACLAATGMPLESMRVRNLHSIHLVLLPHSFCFLLREAYRPL